MAPERPNSDSGYPPKIGKRPGDFKSKKPGKTARLFYKYQNLLNKVYFMIKPLLQLYHGQLKTELNHYLLKGVSIKQ